MNEMYSQDIPNYLVEPGIKSVLKGYLIISP